MEGIYVDNHSWVYKREQCNLLLGHMDLITLYLKLGCILFKSFTTAQVLVQCSLKMKVHFLKTNTKTLLITVCFFVPAVATLSCLSATSGSYSGLVALA